MEGYGNGEMVHWRNCEIVVKGIAVWNNELLENEG